jgi:hypothetical protein
VPTDMPTNFRVDPCMYCGELIGQLRLGGLVSATNRNLDYGIITPVSQIVQTLERAKDANAQFDAWFSLDQAVPQ